MFGLAAIAALLAACTGEPASVDGVPMREQSFSTVACRAPSVAPERPHPGGPWGYRSWRAPDVRPLDLTALAAEVDGDPPEEPGVLARFSSESVAAWARRTHGGMVRWTSEPFPTALHGASRLVMVLRPGTARAVEIVPSFNDDMDPRMRGLRTVSITLDAPADPAAPLMVVADLAAVLGANWGDDARGGLKLRRLEVALPEADADSAVIEEIRIEGRQAVYAGSAAGTAVAEVHGELHPAWYVHAGSAARMTLDVPAGAPELRWYDGAEGLGTREIEVIAGDRTTLLATTRGAGTRWRHRTATLQPWAGQRVTLRLSAVGNGVGLFGAPRVVVPKAHPNTPNVVLYMIDTLRADHLGAYGSTVPEVSPTLDRLASDGAQFGLAISTSPWTKPAIPTLMTGLWPTTHRVGAVTYADRLPDSVPVLAERFGEAGWRTGSFSASPLGSTLSGLERGFDTALPPVYWRGALTQLRHVNADQLHDEMLAWYRTEPGVPFFAYIHTLEVHGWRRAPYEDPPQGFEHYDYAVQDADTKLARLLEGLAAEGLADNTLVVVVSDHGESFGDHGVSGHGSSLYQSQVHVPLVFWAGDDLPPITINDPVGLADVPVTVLDLLGLPPLPHAEGQSLAPYFAGPSAPVHAWVPSARIRYVWKPDDPQLRAVVDNDKRKLMDADGERHVFDLSTDPCESRSLPLLSTALQSAFEGWTASEVAAAGAFEAAHPASGASVDAGDVELMRALGYLE